MRFELTSVLRRGIHSQKQPSCLTVRDFDRRSKERPKLWCDKRRRSDVYQVLVVACRPQRQDSEKSRFVEGYRSFYGCARDICHQLVSASLGK